MQMHKNTQMQIQNVNAQMPSYKCLSKVCTGAWEEDHDTCGVLSTENCEHDFARWTFDHVEKYK